MDKGICIDYQINIDDQISIEVWILKSVWIDSICDRFIIGYGSLNFRIRNEG
jgi:hypothetical protein